MKTMANDVKTPVRQTTAVVSVIEHQYLKSVLL